MDEHREQSAGGTGTPGKSSVSAGVVSTPVSGGPETVINPEGRPAPILPAVDSLPHPSSSIVRTLFPTSDVPGEEPGSAITQGLKLGHFTILNRIRAGGMGSVFCAHDDRLDRTVALKVLPPTQARDPLAIQRFQNEAQAAAQLDHENVARVFYIGEEQGLYFIAFEFVTGANLRELIEQHGQLDLRHAVNYTLQIASALLHTSAQGIIHRDIKPSNIIITPSGRAKLVDLGLARKELKDGDEADLTLAGTTLGTFDYISPEQARDPRTADIRSDIYSLGCTLYHMLTGEPPYPEGTVLQKLLQHQGDDAPDPRSRNRKVPENLSSVVRKMMAKDPRRRYQTADQLMRDLLLVAGSLGLRSVSSEGLMWISAQNQESTFWERHFAWIGTAAALLAIVVYIEFRGPRVTTGPQPSPPHTTAGTASEKTPLLATTGQEASSATDPLDKTPQRSQAASEQEIIPVEAPQPRRRDETPNADLPTEVAIGSVPASPGGSTSDAVTAPARPVASVEARRVFGPQIETGFVGLQPQALDPDAVTRLAPEGPSSPGAPQVALAPSTVKLGPETRQPTNRTRPAEAPLLAPGGIPEPAISIVGLDGTPKESFTTLEAACSAATDGSIIELRFNGRRRERPLHVKKKITIRAGKKYHPLVEFVPMDVPAEGPQTRMIRISSGAIDLVGIDLMMTVDESLSPEHWTLFAMQRPDYVRLQGVTITIDNPRQHPTNVFEFQPSLTSSMPDMGAGLTRPPLEVDLTGSLVRGGGDLFVVKSLEPARLSLKDSVIALQGSLLRSGGVMGTTPPEGGAIELRIDHVTAALADNLVQFDGGYLPRKLLPLQVSMSNSIVESISGQPLVSIVGEGPSPSMRSLLSWSGQKNFYNGFETFWSIASTDPSSKSELLDFGAWQKHWGLAMEVGPREDSVVWQRRWVGIPLTNLAPADFALDPNASQNPAVSGATNGSDAGASLTNVARPPSSEAIASGSER